MYMSLNSSRDLARVVSWVYIKMTDSAEQWRKTLCPLLEGINKYNPEHIDLLEQYVAFQIENDDYNFEANLALMKLYQFQPHRFNPTVACKVFVKTITALPHTHFTLLLSVLPHNQQGNEDIEKISHLHTLLESCDFNKFWSYLADNQDIVFGVNGFVEAVKNFIIDIVNKTHQTISTSLLKVYLGGEAGISDEELLKVAAKESWSVEGEVTRIRGHEEHIKPKRILARIEFESIAPMIAQRSSY